MTDVLADAALRAQRYLANLDARAVAPSADSIAALTAFDEALPENGAPDTIGLLDRIGSPATMAMAGARFFGFVIGGALPVSLAANWLAGAWDQNTAFASVTPAAARLEAVSLRWLVELLGLPTGTGAAFVTGATVANFCALAAARHAVLTRIGWNVEADGLFGAPPVTIVVGAEVHPSVSKSLGLLGFGRSRVVRVPTDEQGRLRVGEFPHIDGPAIVCAQIGNVNTGAFDSVDAIADRIAGSGAWLHIDGAFGLWARASSKVAHLARGIERADSWATDAHKWLNVPYDSGIAFVRDPGALSAAMAITADYLPSGGLRNPCDYTPELSRRARGVDVWAALRSLGRAGVAELVERNCRQARRFADGLRDAGFEVLNDVVLNQVLVSFGDAATTERAIAAVQKDGTCWCGGTVWQGRAAMRISVSSWATTDEDVEKSLAAMVRCARAA